MTGTSAEFGAALKAELGDGIDPVRQAVEQQKTYLRATGQAKDELAAEAVPPLPELVPGDVFLARHYDDPPWRVAGLWPAGGNVVLAAQFKAGKTTMTANLIRCLCDGMPFLGKFAITPPPGRVLVIDAEMPPRSAQNWLADQMISQAGRFAYVPLRGKASTFMITVPPVRSAWAKAIAEMGVSSVILDPIGALLGAIGLDENSSTDVGRFLASFDQMLAEAGATESVVVHHMGHGAERSRGASRLRDWPDAEWRLVREDDNPASPRYLSAYGRDVDLRESLLDYDPKVRHLSLAGGSRADRKTAEALAALLAWFAANPGSSGWQAEVALTGAHPRAAVRAALARATSDNQLTAAPRQGRGGGTVYTVTP